MERIDPRQLLIDIVAILEDIDIPYLVTGGMAVFIWGRPRFTADIDIVVELSSLHGLLLKNALRAFSENGYIDQGMIDEAIRDNGEFNFIDDVTGVRVDFFVLKNYAFDKERLRRKIPKTILGRTIYFTSPEDLILIKALWSKESESTRQREDIASIFAVSGEGLDRTYLHEWSERLDVHSIIKPFLNE
ncbi:hypothetical protein HY623_04275 [Candidatus Uhrbacteria bacterium]|nr:hypothetical protein [Candidatus Uhrbacteria bacterium]